MFFSKKPDQETVIKSCKKIKESSKRIKDILACMQELAVEEAPKKKEVIVENEAKEVVKFDQSRIVWRANHGI